MVTGHPHTGTPVASEAVPADTLPAFRVKEKEWDKTKE